MSVPYKQQMHDGPRSMETQLFLMTQNAKRLTDRVIDLLCELESRNSGAPTDAIQEQMQCTNRRILETDIFMSGYQIKE